MTTVTEGTSTSLEEQVGNSVVASPRVGRTLQDQIRELEPQVAAGLPYSTLTPERFIRTILTEVRKTPKLLECTRESFLGAMMQVAQLGLEVGPSLGQAYLIPYWNRAQRVTECQLQIGYKGYLELAYRGGMIMEAREVYENDEFDFDFGSDPYIHHKWKLGQGRGELIGFYGTVRLPDGRTKFHVMDLDEIEKRRQRAGSKDNGPWKTDYVAMARKTVIRAMVPQTPLTTEMSKLLSEAIRVDDSTVLRDTKGDLKITYSEPGDTDTRAIEATGFSKKQELVDAMNLVEPQAQRHACSRYLLDKFQVRADELTDEQIDEALQIVAGWPETKEAPAAPEAPQERPEGDPTAVDEVLAGLPKKVAMKAGIAIVEHFGATWDGDSDEVLNWLDDWLNQPAEPGDLEAK